MRYYLLFYSSNIFLLICQNSKIYMTSTSNSKTTSGKNTLISSPNTYSYQVTSQFESSGSPGTCNSYDS